jgi:hypothetical protein
MRTQQTKDGSLLARPILVVVALMLVALCGQAAENLSGETLAGMAVESSGGHQAFLRSEVQVLGTGLSGNWRTTDLMPGLAKGQIGGEGLRRRNEVGSVDEEKEDEGGPKNLGDKIKAGTLSAVFPGAGQFYNGQNQKAYIMGGIEVAIWTCYFVFDRQGDNRFDTSTEFAGIFAGTSGEHTDNYWQNVGRYMDSDAYYEAQLREARALGDPTPSPLAGSDSWQWVNNDRRREFGGLRADANSAYDRRDFMLLFAVVNRAVAVVDAVLGVGAADGKLETEVMGLNLQMEMLPSWQDPGAQCVVSRRF